MCIAAAIIGGAGLTAGASYFGSKKQAGAATKAADLQQSTFQTLNAQQQPFIQGGYSALGKLNTLLGLNPNPNYRPSYRPKTSQQGGPLYTTGSNYQVPFNPFAPRTGTPPRIPYDPPVPGGNQLYPGLPPGTFGATMTPDIYRMMQGSIR